MRISTLILPAALLTLPVFACKTAEPLASQSRVQSEPPVKVQPSVETAPVHHPDDNADDTAIWIHPENASLSLIIGDDKEGGVLVWDLDGKELQVIDDSKNMNNLDLRYNFPLRGTYADGRPHERVALVGVVNETDVSLSFYKVNASTRGLEAVGNVKLDKQRPYGGCMYHSPTSGKYYFFPNWRSGKIQQIELTDAGNGTIRGIKIDRRLGVRSQPEGCVADDGLQHLYVGEEDKGVWKFGAEPESGNTREPVDMVGRRSAAGLKKDVEGMSLYYKTGSTGYLIVSSQGNSTFAVYTREGGNDFLGSFTIAAQGPIDEVTETDGLDVTNFPLGPGFPSGVLVAHDHDNDGGSGTNHKMVPFERIAESLGLTMDAEWDPRKVGIPQR
jgi:3-phytase